MGGKKRGEEGPNGLKRRVAGGQKGGGGLREERGRTAHSRAEVHNEGFQEEWKGPVGLRRKEGQEGGGGKRFRMLGHGNYLQGRERHRGGGGAGKSSTYILSNAERKRPGKKVKWRNRAKDEGLH